ncbi:hypothetical protein NQ315_001773 [Exocentrus adspersus]|uniref:Ribosomal protein L1 n=1 Tax=Exocentrus adspersus TaxID=1586481 RepID=A0AAV8W9L2_9CUCU|nr:hypothetical protein NQ315_001773 [Exocentrus adspersus]
MSTKKSPNIKKGKRKLDKNSSFSGVESKRTSPKHRRKSIAALLPTSINEWSVSSSKDTPVKRKQSFPIDFNDRTKSSIGTSSKTPKIKKAVKKKLVKTQDVSIKSEEKSVEDVEDDSNEIDESQDKFGINAKKIAEAVKAVIKLHSENPKLQNQLFKDTVPLSLQISCHKLAEGPPRIIRIPIPNSILTPDSEVCLIVPELKGVKNIEHEKHVEHYENLLRNKGVENIKKIMTFHEFRTEYETFEQKLRLVDLYDLFLVDGKISGKVVKKCGKIFYKKHKLPTPVKLHVTKLKEHIDKALSKAYFFLHMKGNSFSVQFGHDKMPVQDLVDNVYAVIEGLDKEFPGKFENIKGIHVCATRAAPLPIYLSFKKSDKVQVSKNPSKKPKAFKIYQGELTTLPDAEVVVHPSGQVLVKRTKKKNGDEDDTLIEGNVAVVEESSEVNVKKSKKRKSEKGAVNKVDKKKVGKGVMHSAVNVDVGINENVNKKIKTAVKMAENVETNVVLNGKQKSKKLRKVLRSEK